MSNAGPADNLENAPEDSESLNPRALTTKLAEFERSLAARRKCASVFMVLSLLASAVLFIAICIQSIGYYLRYEFEVPIGVYSLCLINICGWLISLWLKRKSAGYFINKLVEKQAIGSLIGVLSLNNTCAAYDKRTRKSAGEALVQLLLETPPIDLAHLTPSERKALAEIAGREDDGKLVNAIVEVLAAIGREESMWHLGSLADRKAKYKGEEARDAAQKALVLVQERAERDKLHGALLRAAEEGPDQEASLVRPSFGPATANETLLLRTPEEQEIQHLGR